MKQSTRNSVHFFVCLQILSLFIINVIDCFGHYVGLSYEIIAPISKITIAALFIIILLMYWRKLPQHVYIFGLCSFSVIILNLAFFTIPQFNETIVTFSMQCFTFYVIGSLIDDFKYLRKTINVVSYFCAIVISILVVLNSLGIIVLLNKWGNAGYSMGLGNACTLPSIFLFWKYFEEKKIFDLLCGIFLFLGVISFGSRSPILGILSFFFYYWYRTNRGKKLWKIILWCMIGACFLLSYDFVLPAIGDFFHSLGIQSRTIDLVFADNKELHLSNRDVLQEKLISIMKVDPMSIRGINAEYLVNETYAHNVFIEVLYQFGFPLGVLISIFIMRYIVLSLRNIGTNDTSMIVAIFMITVVSHSLFSGSIWTMPYFWFWLSILRTSRTKRFLRPNYV